MSLPHPLVRDPSQPVRIGMYGVAHSHARGKAAALRAHPQVVFAGVYEPDPQRRAQAQGHPAFAGVTWLESTEALLERVDAVCVEGPEGRCASTALECVQASKHLWYDKPAGDWPMFRQIVETARERGLLVQMGYMLRYNAAFQQIDEWLRAGLLGDLFALRGHMSTYTPESTRGASGYPGGVAFQLASHMIDPAVWLFGSRPTRVTSFLRNDATPSFPAYADNTLVVVEFEGGGEKGARGAGGHRSARGLALIDIASMEPPPTARRFEVYGTRGSAIVLEPFEPGGAIRLCLTEASGSFRQGVQVIAVAPTPRELAYRHELEAFVRTLRGEQSPDRPLDHELRVEETLHRAVGTIR